MNDMIPYAFLFLCGTELPNPFAEWPVFQFHPNEAALSIFRKAFDQAFRLFHTLNAF